PGARRSRTGRMTEFASVGEVQDELEVLAGQPEPLVRLLARRPGQKEDRWQQELARGPEGGSGGVPVGSDAGSLLPDPVGASEVHPAAPGAHAPARGVL